MSLQKLQKQLSRELKTNPKKAGMLALLAVVAGWFWVPLVFKSTPPTPTVPASSAASPTPAAVPAPQAVAAKAEPRQAWHEIALAIDGDPEMSPASLAKLAEDCDAFAPVSLGSQVAADQGASPESVVDPATVEAEVEEIDPARAGLVVSSTLIGSSRSAARIGGRVYGVGDEIEIQGARFIVAKVESQRVILERQGRQYPVALKRRPNPIKIEARAVPSEDKAVK